MSTKPMDRMAALTDEAGGDREQREPGSPTPPASTRPAEADESPLAVLLEADRRAPSWPTEASFVAICVDSRHPTLLGRVKVVCDAPRSQGTSAAPFEWWVPTLHGQTIRAGDRVLCQRVAGSDEPIVIGVIDGFLPRPDPQGLLGPRLELKRDEVLRIQTEDGRELVEMVTDDDGPIVRLLHGDTRLDLRGKLSITAAELELKASKGAVRIEASDDLRLVGELVHLN